MTPPWRSPPAIPLYWLVLTLLLSGFVLGRGYNHDEEQFIAAAVLGMDSLPYRDFLYLQPPAYLALLSGLYRLLGLEDGYFLAGRLLNLGMVLLAVAALWRFARHHTGTAPAAMAVATLFVTSTVIQPAIDSLRNDMAPCALALWALVLLLTEMDRPVPRRRVAALVGLLLAMAVGMKLSYAFAPPVIAAYLLIRRRDLLWPLLAGGLAGTLCLLPWALSGWPGFVEGVFTYHRVTPPLWHAEAGLSAYFTLEYLAEFLNRRVMTDAVLAVLLLLAATAFLARRDTDVAARLRAGHAGLLGSLMLAALIVGLLPRPPYIQYFMPFAAVVILTLPVAWAALATQTRTRDALLAAVLLLGALPGMLVMLANVPRLLQPEKWMVNRVALAGNAIAAEMRAAGLSGPVATLSPIPVLEAGLPIYPELATGPFFYRTADRHPAEKLQRLNAVGRRDLPALLRARPPAAILLGREDAALEQPLLDHALANGFVEKPVPAIRGLRLFLAPPAR